MKLRFHGKLGFNNGSTTTACVAVFSVRWQVPPNDAAALKRTPVAPEVFKRVYYFLYNNGFIRTLTSTNAYCGTTRLSYLDLEDSANSVEQLQLLAFQTNLGKEDPKLPPMPAFDGFKRSAEKTRPALSKNCVLMAPGVFEMQRHPLTGFDADFSPFCGLVIDLSDENLCGVKFGKADFRLANITGTALARSDISRSQFAKDALKGHDLSSAKLAGGDFSGFDFSKTNLQGADLRGADLSKTMWNNVATPACGLENALLDNAKFINALMTEVVLRKVTAVKANFGLANMSNCDATGSTWSNADFTSAVVNNTTFKNAKGDGVVFRKATLTGCDAAEAVWPQANFRGSALTKVTLTGANLTGAVFNAGESLPAAALVKIDFGDAILASADFSDMELDKGAVLFKRPKFGTSEATATRFRRAVVPQEFLGMDWSYLDIENGRIVFGEDFKGDKVNAEYAIIGRNTLFAGKSFKKAKFSHAKLSECVFRDCNLSEAKFESTVLAKAIFFGADLTGVEFINTDLNGTDFTKAWLQQTKFQKATLVQTVFASACLLSADFKAPSGGMMQGVNFSGAYLVNADFSDVSLMPYSANKTSFVNACLLGANFKGAKLHSASLGGAQLSKKNGTIMLTKKPGDQPVENKYSARELPMNVTGPATLCPVKGWGPCDDEKLYTTNIPEEWSRTSSKGDTDEVQEI